MSNIEITSNQTVDVVIHGEQYIDDVVTFAGAGTLKAGTILARDSVSLKLVPFVKGGSTNENGIPKGVIRGAITATAAGDLACRPLVVGKVRQSLLVIDADGDASNIDAKITDQLRNYGIATYDTTELTKLDNQ